MSDTAFTTTNSVVVKRYYYKIYTKNLAYITTWSTDVISDPNYKNIINGGAGELTVQLARPYNSFGEGNDVTLGNRVELWVADNDNLSNNSSSGNMWDSALWDVDNWDSPVTSFRKIYSGFISAYSPVLDGENQYIEITVLGYVAELSLRVLKDSSANTTVTYSIQDPGTIMRDMIDKYRADGGTNINYTGGSIQTVGISVSYSFKNQTLKDCFDRLLKMCPIGWYWFIDPTGTVYMKISNATADHKLTIGSDISYLKTNKRIENLVNNLFLVGGGATPLFNVYARSASQSTWGKFEKIVQDGQVTDNTSADYIAKSNLDQNDSPETRTILRITDDNGEQLLDGENIENYNVGDTIQIKNLKYGASGLTLWNVGVWDTDVWDSTIQFTTADVLIIQSIDYNKDYIEIEAASRLPAVERRIEDVNKLAVTVAQSNLPTTPTPRTV